MKNKNKFYLSTFVISLLALMLVGALIYSYQKSNSHNEPINSYELSLPKSRKNDVIDFAWKFLEAFYRNDPNIKSEKSRLIQNLSEFKSYPSEADFFVKSRTWNVFFTNGITSYNIEVDDDLSKGTIHLLNVMFDDNIDNQDINNQNPKLYKLADFEKLFSLTQNRHLWQ
jgi:hypothetical protein